MTEYLVTGIASSSDAAEIAKALAGEGLDELRLSTVTKSSAQARLHVVDHLGSPSFSSGGSLNMGSSGTGVPGVGGSHASLSSFSAHGAVADYLGGVPLIPPDQAEHFNIAIGEGRALVMYKATPEEAPHAEAAFRAAGLRNVKQFKPKATTV